MYLFIHVWTSVTFKVLSIWWHTTTETVFALLKTVFGLINFDAFSVSVIFCFNCSTLAKCFPLKTFFHPGKQKQLLLERSGEQGGWGMGVLPLLVTHYWALSTVRIGVLINHPSWNGQMYWVFKTNSLKPKAASHNNSSWYTDRDKFLEHSASGGSLYWKGPAFQKVILFFFGGGPPLVLKRDLLTLKEMMTRISKDHLRNLRLPTLLLCFQIYTMNLLFNDALPSLPNFCLPTSYSSGLSSILPDLGKMVKKMLYNSIRLFIFK